MGKFKYNSDYYKKISDNCRLHAKEISEARWDFVKGIEPKIVLDYGCGPRNLERYAPDGVVVDSYDIGEIDGEPYPQTGIIHDWYDVVFMNDVLEHIPDFSVLDNIFNIVDYVSVSVPIYPGSEYSYEEIARWKHNKFSSGEHLHYFTERFLLLFFLVRGFQLAEKGEPESFIRKDIKTYLFERIMMNNV